MEDITLKLHAYPGAAKRDVVQDNRVEEKNTTQDMAIKAAQLEEEKSRSLEHLKTIVQLRESLKQEKAKTAELEAKLNKLDVLEENQRGQKNVQLEEARKQSLEFMRTIEQLRETIKQDQAKISAIENKSAELEAKTKELAVELEAKTKALAVLEAKTKELSVLEAKAKEHAVLEAKLKDLSGVLNKISSIAATGKIVGDD